MVVVSASTLSPNRHSEYILCLPAKCSKKTSNIPSLWGETTRRLQSERPSPPQGSHDHQKVFLRVPTFINPVFAIVCEHLGLANWSLRSRHLGLGHQNLHNPYFGVTLPLKPQPLKPKLAKICREPEGLAGLKRILSKRAAVDHRRPTALLLHAATLSLL